MDNKEKFFEIYEKYFSTNFGKLKCCSNCNCWCENQQFAVLFPFEDEFILKKTGKIIYEENIEFGKGIKIIGKKCKFSDGTNCLIHNSRPMDCRMYPFYPEIIDNEFVLLMDNRCVLAEDLATNSEHLKNVIRFLTEITPLVDREFWKFYSTIGDKGLKARKVCDIKQLST